MLVGCFGMVRREEFWRTVDDTLYARQALSLWRLVDVRPWLAASHLASIRQCEVDGIV